MATPEENPVASHSVRADRTRRVARLVAVLNGHQKGATIQHIMRATNASRATAYRDLALLKESGYLLQVHTVNGEARYSLAVSELSTKPMGPKEHAAIALARRALSPIEGSWIVQELDATLKRAQGNDEPDTGVRLQLAPLAYRPDIVRTLHEAVTNRRKLRIRYQGVNDAIPSDRVVHPVELHVVDQQPYLIGWDDHKRAQRTFKVARISHAKILRHKAQPLRSPERRSSASSVKVWSSDPVEVRIRIAKSAARYVHEWPLVPGQILEAAPGGAVDVRARVYGIEETLRWVLRWGRNAEALEPRALRDRVRQELESALAGYRTKKVSQLK